MSAIASWTSGGWRVVLFRAALRGSAADADGSDIADEVVGLRSVAAAAPGDVLGAFNADDLLGARRAVVAWFRTAAVAFDFSSLGEGEASLRKDHICKR